MARRKPHEDHVNHEAWAIPYGDLITLLLAFFVVMYAVSSVNAGKYRVLSDALNSAFSGTPTAIDPIQYGQKQLGSGSAVDVTAVERPRFGGRPVPTLEPIPTDRAGQGDKGQGDRGQRAAAQDAEAQAAQLGGIADAVERAMATLVMQDQLVVRNHGDWVEVEIRNDLLFGSGVATLSAEAESVLAQLAGVLSQVNNPIRVEGHTDNLPIRTLTFPSNWELSAARAATVVRLFASRGLSPGRMAVLGLGEFRPIASNQTADGRNSNRRVLLAIQPLNGEAEGSYATTRGQPGTADVSKVTP